MIAEHTRHHFIAFLRILRGPLALWLILYFLIGWLYYERPDLPRIEVRLQWYLLAAMGSGLLLSLTSGNAIRTVLMLSGLAVLALAQFTSFSPRWLWLAGCLLIVGVLFFEALPHLRWMFASFRKTYRKISKISET